MINIIVWIFLGSLGLVLALYRLTEPTRKIRLSALLATLWCVSCYAVLTNFTPDLVLDPIANYGLHGVNGAWIFCWSLLAGCATYFAWQARKVLGLLSLCTTFVLTAFVYALHGQPLIAAFQISILLLVASAPGVLLATWTSKQSNLAARTTLQTILWFMLVLYVLPTIVLRATDAKWETFIQQPTWALGLSILGYGLCIGLLLSATHAFYKHGSGTAFPYDPPKRLVVSGIYAYIRNPMQVGIYGYFLITAWALDCPWLYMTGLNALVLYLVFAGLCNGDFDDVSHDDVWQLYQSEVRKWWPRLTPFKPQVGAPI
jgi:protein-S-isoprenylcysteine O-methyltransferase Ste14